MPNDREPRPDLAIAISTFRAALEERTHDRVPLDWAATQNSLGVVLVTFGRKARVGQSRML
jgi:hypothetical protein